MMTMRPYPIRHSAMVLLVILLMALGALPAEARESAPEDAVKAAILHNLGNFVDWQTGIVPGPDNPIIVGVIGLDSLQERLVSMAEVKGGGQRRPIAILAIKDLQQLRNQRDRLHVLYITRSAQHMTTEILHLVAGLPILTISDDEKFVDAGGIMNFARENSRIRFDINLNAAEASGLKLSARLFGLARRIIKQDPVKNSF